MNHLAPALIFVLLAAPAIRLLLLATRTRRAPEIWGGLYFLGTSIGMPLRILGHALAPTDPARAADFNTFGHAFFAAATCALTVFTWQVFRRKERWAAAFAPTLILSIAATTAYVLSTGTESVEGSMGVLLTNAARLAPILWAFAESARYWRIMRRRGALGLADPVVTNRFLLWTFWTGALALLPAMTLSLRMLRRFGEWLGMYAGADLSHEPTLVFAIRAVFLLSAPIGAVALSLSFFPPERYQRWIRARAETGASGSPMLGGATAPD